MEHNLNSPEPAVVPAEPTVVPKPKTPKPKIKAMAEGSGTVENTRLSKAMEPPAVLIVLMTPNRTPLTPLELIVAAIVSRSASE